VDYLAIDG